MEATIKTRKVKCISDYKHENTLRIDDEYYVLSIIKDMYIIGTSEDKKSFVDVVPQNRFELL